MAYHLSGNGIKNKDAGYAQVVGQFNKTFGKKFTIDGWEKKMKDPTYNKEEIDADPEWRLAFVLSEIMNDDAPLGWSRYIFAAKCLLSNCEVKWR